MPYILCLPVLGLRRGYLIHGNQYTVTVKAVNKAGLISVGQFAQLLVDNTPPKVTAFVYHISNR